MVDAAAIEQDRKVVAVCAVEATPKLETQRGTGIATLGVMKTPPLASQ